MNEDCVGVVAVGVAVFEGRGHSQADLKLYSETAVWGSDISRLSEADSARQMDIIVPSPCWSFSGFRTSFATLMTVSNSQASAAVGSR